MTLWNENIWNTFYISTKSLWVWIKSKKLWGVDKKFEPFEKSDQFLVISFVEYHISKSTWEWLVFKIFWKFIKFIYFSFTLIEYGTIINYGFKQLKISKNDISAIIFFFVRKQWLSIFTQMNLSIIYIYMLLMLKS
jgi:hypothetical protein